MIPPDWAAHLPHEVRVALVNAFIEAEAAGLGTWKPVFEIAPGRDDEVDQVIWKHCGELVNDLARRNLN